MIVVKNKADCCGCTACYSVCPQKAISMQQDQEGFLYPFVEISKCIDCKLCDSVCPIENKVESKMFDRKAYVLRARRNCFYKYLWRICNTARRMDPKSGRCYLWCNL